jgi:hypothetical protein
VNPGVASVGIRVNAFASGVVFPSQIAALITSSPAGVISITNNFLNIAIPQPGLQSSTSFKAGGGIAQCTKASLGATPAVVNYTGGTGFTATDPVTGTAGVLASSVPTTTVVEGFPSAFAVAPANVALVGSALVAGSGGGAVNPNGAAPSEGADATQGTQLTVTVTGLPANTVIVAANFLGTLTTTGSSMATAGQTTVLSLVTGAGAAPTPANNITPLGTGATVITGNTVTYEVIQTSAGATETIVIPLALYTIGTPSPSGAATSSVQLAPVSTVGTAVTTPIPRFGAAPLSGSFVSVIPCATNVLFPFVSQGNGYDTGFAISNTTADAFGTASQSGTCVYNFYGTNPPSGGTFTTKSFGGGTTDTELLSVMAPGFQGYIIAVCNFQLGHGFDFIAGPVAGGTVVGQGGPALIILQPGATSATSRKGAAGVANGFGQFGEALAH